jgi:hypothetical protein
MRRRFDTFLKREDPGDLRFRGPMVFGAMSRASNCYLVAGTGGANMTGYFDFFRNHGLITLDIPSNVHNVSASSDSGGGS